MRATPHGESSVLRVPRVGDAKGIGRLVRESETLDVNSDYAYLLLCHHFRQTCVVAEWKDDLVGFAAAYSPPDARETLFVWQIAVKASARGERLASRMLDELIRRGQGNGVHFLEATVTPSNRASRALFRSVATRHEVGCEISPLFSREDFPAGGDHEAEELFRIGPFP